jgi:hypothetical protein
MRSGSGKPNGGRCNFTERHLPDPMPHWRAAPELSAGDLGARQQYTAVKEASARNIRERADVH